MEYFLLLSCNWSRLCYIQEMNWNKLSGLAMWEGRCSCYSAFHMVFRLLQIIWMKAWEYVTFSYTSSDHLMTAFSHIGVPFLYGFFFLFYCSSCLCLLRQVFSCHLSKQRLSSGKNISVSFQTISIFWKCSMCTREFGPAARNPKTLCLWNICPLRRRETGMMF